MCIVSFLWYCWQAQGFHHYSSWKEIDDEKFHRLKNAYLDAAEALERYVNDKAKEE